MYQENIACTVEKINSYLHLDVFTNYDESTLLSNVSYFYMPVTETDS